jgi:LuxR family transcriptional regulator, maltose regulon positive regulatory protein
VVQSRSSLNHAEPQQRPLLISKITAPPLQPGIVSRGRLLARLDEDCGKPLSIVIAPAGWGKTTLLAEWANRAAEHAKVAWLTLDGTDDELNRFWTQVIRAVTRVAPDIGKATQAALRIPGIDPLEVALPALLNDLAVSQTSHVLILDDYHVLTDLRIHEAVEYVLSYLPPSQRLVIAGRFDPPLPLARMRARGQLNEVRAGDLRFSSAEAASLVSTVGQVELGDQAMDALVERTEGWAVGLKLAALTIRNAPNPETRAAEVHGDDRHIIDFLTSEVLDRLPMERRDFLIRTAILDSLCGSLCDAVLERKGSAAILEALERDDLFVVPLDPHRTWYRYHRLFRDALRRELDLVAPQQIPDLLRRAADWYSAAGEIAEAVRHLIAAGDRHEAAQLLLSAEDMFLEHGEAATYLRLGDDLGEATIREDPRLCVTMAGAAAQCGRLDRVPALLDIAEPRLRTGEIPAYSGWCSLAAAAEMLRASCDENVRADPDAMLAHAERAAKLETDPTLPGYVISGMTLGVVLSGLDRHEQAVEVLTDAWERSARVSMPAFIRMQIAGLLAMCLFESGRDEAAQRLIRQVLPAMHQMIQGLGDAAAPAVVFLVAVEGRLALREGRTDAARQLLARAAELAQVAGHPSQTVNVLIALADAELAAGDRRAARAALEEARETADVGIAFPATARRLAGASGRIGRGARRTPPDGRGSSSRSSPIVS